jgi:CelD/BcsL family acetyltransferase involved in cellulose biosynthesis
LIRDEFFAHAVRDEHGRLVAVAPLMLTHQGPPGFPRARMLQFFGCDPFMTEIRGLVCRPADQHDVIGELHRYLLAHDSEYDWCRWSGIYQNRLAAGSPRVEWDVELPNFYLDLPTTWEKFKAGLSRNIKESLRKCYNSLKRDGHEFVFRVVSRPADMRAALDRFFELHSMRARVKHTNVFATPRARAFLVDYAECMAAADSLRIFQLEIGGVVVATRIGFVHGRELYLYYSGYDVEWGQYSVMTTVTAEAIRWAIESHFTIVNLSAGRDVSKTRWSPTEIVFCEGTQISSTWRGRVAFHVHRDVLALHRRDSPVRRLLARVR